MMDATSGYGTIPVISLSYFASEPSGTARLHYQLIDNHAVANSEAKCIQS